MRDSDLFVSADANILRTHENYFSWMVLEDQSVLKDT